MRLTHCISNKFSGVAVCIWKHLEEYWSEPISTQYSHATGLGKAPYPGSLQSREICTMTEDLACLFPSLSLMDRSNKPLSPTKPSNHLVIIRQQHQCRLKTERIQVPDKTAKLLTQELSCVYLAAESIPARYPPIQGTPPFPKGRSSQRCPLA